MSRTKKTGNKKSKTQLAKLWLTPHSVDKEIENNFLLAFNNTRWNLVLRSFVFML